MPPCTDFNSGYLATLFFSFFWKALRALSFILQRGRLEVMNVSMEVKPCQDSFFLSSASTNGSRMEISG